MSREAAQAEIMMLAQEAEAAGASLTPEMVVEAAKNPASALHACFEWDADKAAKAHWLDTARALIRTVVVRVTTTRLEVTIPRYIRDPTAPADQQGYVSLGRLRTDEELARAAIVAEFVRASSALERARNIAAALGMDADIEQLRSGIEGLADRARYSGSEGHA